MNLLTIYWRANRLPIATFCSVFAVISRLWSEDNHEWVQRRNTPAWVVQLFSARNLEAQYEFAFTVNPFYLRGDFTGDGKPEVAVLVKNKQSGKMGIAICNGAKNEIFFVGAGTAVGNGGDDFSWMDVWQVYPRRSATGNARASVKLIGEALLVENSEAGGGLIYWDGKKYAWQQHGD